MEGIKVFVTFAVVDSLFFLQRASGEPVCYSREEIDDRSVVVRRVPCNESGYSVHKMFELEEGVDVGALIASEPQLEVSCSFEELPAVLNGEFKMSDCTGRKPMDTCTITCNNGYNLSSHDVKTTCQDKGNKLAVWSKGTFNCQPKSCLELSSWRGRVYTLVKTTMTWDEADMYCRSMSAHLVYINDAEENNFLKNLTNCEGHALAPGSYASVGLIRGTLSLNGDVRLFDGNDNCEGKVEMWYNGQWGTLCSDSWNIANADVVCGQLGRGPAVSTNTEEKLEEGSAFITLDEFSCKGDEERLIDCPGGGFISHDCSHGQYIVVNCTCETAKRNIRLVGGKDDSEGRVEVFYNGQWGTICDDFWTFNDADVVCRQLGRGPAIVIYGKAHFGVGTGSIVLDNVFCQGDEETVLDCPSSKGPDSHDCDHYENAGVKCAYGSSWRWQDGSKTVFTNWQPSQLEEESYPGDEWSYYLFSPYSYAYSYSSYESYVSKDCVGVDNNGLWYIYPCETLNYAICEK